MSHESGALPELGAALDLSVPASVAVSRVSGFDSESLESLELCYGRARRKYQELTFEFSRDPALIHQYHLIYEREFRAVHNPHYQHLEDEHDRHSHFLIIRRGNLCVGGARLTVKSPRQSRALPIEMNNFRLEDHFPDLGVKQITYGQVGRICLLPEFRGGNATRMLLWHIHRKATALGVTELFGTATIAGVRSYRRDCRAIGLDRAKIHLEIRLPDYPMCEEIRFYLIEIPLDKAPLERENISLMDTKASFEEA